MVIRQGEKIPGDVLGRVRRMLNEPGQTPFNDEVINTVWLANDGLFEATVADLWEEKAARQAELVDVSEGSSSRKMSQVRSASLDMSALWRKRAEKASETAEPVPVVRRTVSRPIVRV